MDVLSKDVRVKLRFKFLKTRRISPAQGDGCFFFFAIKLPAVVNRVLAICQHL